MKKIPSLFQRNYDGDFLVRDELVPGTEWVVAGEGVATRKYDGTAVLIQGGQLFKRYDAKTFTIDRRTGAKQPWNRKPPEGFMPAQEPDPETGHWPGWVPCRAGAPDDRWAMEAFAGPCAEHESHSADQPWTDGTYELCGPKVSANPEGFASHVLIPHGKYLLPEAPRTFEAIKGYLATLALDGQGIEGIVWHHPDGRMVKIKTKDFGLNRGPRRVDAP
jgi:hypothetical protein